MSARSTMPTEAGFGAGVDSPRRDWTDCWRGMMGTTTDDAGALPLDFRLLFEAAPDILLVLLPDAPDFTMVGATESRLLATHTTREGTMGRGLFEVFPDNP